MGAIIISYAKFHWMKDYYLFYLSDFDEHLGHDLSPIIIHYCIMNFLYVKLGLSLSLNS